VKDGGSLPEAAERLLDDLTERYIVERRESKEALEPDTSPVRVIRLIPHTPAAGPLAVAFTEPSGIVLRLGRWYVERMRAGRAQDPAEAIAELKSRVDAHVEGGLWERVRRGVTGSWQETRLVGADCDLGGRALLEPVEARSARREGFAAPVQWAPWPRRNLVVAA
jgi:hypothetical protein